MKKITRFGKIVVHGYQKVDQQILRDIIVNRLDDFAEFAAVIRSRLPQQ